ncbi:MAG: pyridoxamine kinase [Clostridia bacterium]|nr:pyridoxamine kinase [Clostridia bacterium]
MKQKRLATVQDISCLGKCSLTAAISVISAFGMEAVVLPTAVLSTHTGADFSDYTFRDLTEEMPGIINHWHNMVVRFDALYSGYLGSIHQLDIVEKFFTDFKTKDNLIFVDPVMGDDGRLYSGFDMSFAKRMYSLCSHADVICPNVTEAALLTGSEYRESHDIDYVRTLAHKLTSTGAKTVIVTGLTVGNSFGALCLDTSTGREYTYYREKIPGCYYGTGDLFASVLCCSLTMGMPMEEALKLAIDFVYQSILSTQDELQKYKYGVKFEQNLGLITDYVRNKYL